MSTLKDPMQLLGDEFAPPSFAPPGRKTPLLRN
jgi:hypothetical protein